MQMVLLCYGLFGQITVHSWFPGTGVIIIWMIRVKLTWGPLTNMDPFMSHLATQLGYSAGEFQALQLIVLSVFGVMD